jgi:hypothetical protein
MTAEVTLAVSDSEVSLSSTAAQNVLQVSSWNLIDVSIATWGSLPFRSLH